MFKIIVEQVKQEPKVLTVDLAPQQMELDDPDYKFEGRVTGEIEFKAIGRDIRGVGALDVDTLAQCVRCLDPVHEHLHVPVDVTWLFHDAQAHHYKEPDIDLFMAEKYEGDILDAQPILRELILTATPTLPLCSPECKGLCPGCGANLNREPCQCKPVRAEVDEHDRWKDKLKGLQIPDSR